MVAEAKELFLAELSRRYGPLRRLAGSQSLYEIAGGAIRILLRYSRVHGSDRTFYGIREQDLRQLQGHPSLICFVWNGQHEPLFVPFADYEDVFQSVTPAGDGQYKAQVLLHPDGTELYIARAGRFNVEAHMGWGSVEALVQSAGSAAVPELSHTQMQSLLGAIGVAKSYDVWIPTSDRPKLDWSIAQRFACCDSLPAEFGPVDSILQEVDVVWIKRGSGELRALFEVEHSTPIYSALLRFNDIHLVAPKLRPAFSVVANDARRQLFVRQLARPTFVASGLSGLCTFLDYTDVFDWHRRVARN